MISQKSIASSSSNTSSQRTDESSVVHTASLQPEVVSSDETLDDEFPRKRVKKEGNQIKSEKDAARPARIKENVVNAINSYFAMSDFEGRIDTKDVNVTTADSGIMTVDVKCLLCKAGNVEKSITLAATKYSFVPNNYKRHMIRIHLDKDAAFGPGMKIKKAKVLPRSVMEFMKAGPSSESSKAVSTEESELDDDEDARADLPVLSNNQPMDGKYPKRKRTQFSSIFHHGDPRNAKQAVSTVSADESEVELDLIGEENDTNSNEK